MSTLEDLDDLERHEKDEKKDEDQKKDGDGKKADGDADMKDAEPEEEEEQLDEDILNSSTRDIIARRRLLENDMRIMKSEFQRLNHEKAAMNDKIKDNLEKIENNRYVLTQPRLGSAAHMVAVNSNKHSYPAGNSRTSSATLLRY